MKAKLTAALTVAAAVAFLCSCEANDSSTYSTSESKAPVRSEETKENPVIESSVTEKIYKESTVSKPTTSDATTRTESKPAPIQTETTVATTLPSTTKAHAPEWTESKLSATMYVNTAGIYSRSKALLGAPVIRQYSLNDKVSVTAVTNTDYYKLADGSFIHTDYLSTEKTVIKTTAPPKTSAPAPVSVKPQASASSSKYISSGYSQLDELMTPILDDLISDKMSDTEKLRAIYDYLTNFSYFERTLLIPQSQKNYTEQLYAKWLLENKYGVCYDFSAAFKYMTRAIGFDTQMIYGWHTNSGGGAGEHSWCELIINGTTYIFDPAIELVMKSEGYLNTTRFMQTYSQIGHFYIK